MFSRYPFLLLVSLSAVGAVMAVALLFADRRLAVLTYAGTAIGLVVIIAWFVRRDSSHE